MKEEYNLLKWDDYYSSYCYYLGQDMTARQAFDRVWVDFVEQTGVEKVEVVNFDSLESFRSSMYQRLKKKKTDI